MRPHGFIEFIAGSDRQLVPPRWIPLSQAHPRHHRRTYAPAPRHRRRCPAPRRRRQSTLADRERRLTGCARRQDARRNDELSVRARGSIETDPNPLNLLSNDNLEHPLQIRRTQHVETHDLNFQRLCGFLHLLPQIRALGLRGVDSDPMRVIPGTISFKWATRLVSTSV